MNLSKKTRNLIYKKRKQKIFHLSKFDIKKKNCEKNAINYKNLVLNYNFSYE